MTFFIARMVLKDLAGPVPGEVWTLGRCQEVLQSRKLAVLVEEGRDAVRQMMH